jgi:membrane-associated protein
MGDDLFELPSLLADLSEFAPNEVLPLDGLPVPVHAAAWLTRLIFLFSRYAYSLGFFGALVENTVLLGFLLPGGTVVALAGAGARTAGLSLPLLILFGAAGMTGGAIIDYFLGRAGIVRLLRHRWTGKWGRQLEGQLDQAAPLLNRHGWWMMLIAHAFGHGRSSLAVAAGASGLPLHRLIAIELPAALLWSAFYTGGGYFLADRWHVIEVAFRRAGWIGAAFTIAGFLGWWGWRRVLQQRQAAQSMRSAPATAPAAVRAVETAAAPAARSTTSLSTPAS